MLDINCRPHELENVYVTDGSFFVSAGAVNPSLTIIANSLRVSEYLKRRFYNFTQGCLKEVRVISLAGRFYKPSRFYNYRINNGLRFHIYKGREIQSLVVKA